MGVRSGAAKICGMSIPLQILKRAAMALLMLGAGTAGVAAGPPTSPQPDARPRATGQVAPGARHHGARQVGKASIYARKFAGRKMANGQRMDPRGSNAASKTLPLGTRARVTNLETGRSAVVTIEDHGPHVRGRIIDLSPATAGQIGLTREQGIAPVEVSRLN